jgi:hypothetical protein
MDLDGIAVVNWLRVGSPRTEVRRQVPLTTRSKATTLPAVAQHCHTNILAAGAVHMADQLGSTAWHYQPTEVGCFGWQQAAPQPLWATSFHMWVRHNSCNAPS